MLKAKTLQYFLIFLKLKVLAALDRALSVPPSDNDSLVV